MTDDQIRYMVQRFLMWRLPENFNPDGGVSFEPVGNAGTVHEYKRNPVGTNLLDAMQAEAMIRYLLDGLATPPQQTHLNPQQLLDEVWTALMEVCEFSGDGEQTLDIPAMRDLLKRVDAARQ